jgi:3-hydroxyacyl-CoA dehydrogenase
MIADGYTGRKGKGGFYRMNKEGGQKVKEAIDLQSGTYHVATKPKLESAELGKKGIGAVIAHPDKGGQYARSVLLQTLSYAAALVPEIADDLASVDAAMRTGYAWKYGPFEMIDAIGVDVFAAELAKDGMPVPALVKLAQGRSFYKAEGAHLLQLMPDGSYAALKRPAGVLLLADIKRAGPPVAKNTSASLWDIGDGVLCLEFTSKMNAIDDQIFAMYRKALALIGDGRSTAYKALVIHNEGENFSVGANLGIAMFALECRSLSADRPDGQRRAGGLQSLEICPIPGGLCPGRAGLGRRL